MKVILVMEMPESCLECPCVDACGESCQVTDREIGTYEDNYINGQYDKPGWCPLVPMPERKMELEKKTYFMGEYAQSIYVPVLENKGWNACLDAIEGRKG